MNNIDVSSLLAEMRSLAAQAQSLDAAAGPADDAVQKTRFADLLGESVDVARNVKKL